MNKQLIVLIGRCAAGATEVHKRLVEAGVNAIDASISDLKQLLNNRPKNTDIFVVWVKAPLCLRVSRFLEREGDTLESRSKLVDRIISDGKDFSHGLSNELNDYLLKDKSIKYWLPISNAQTNENRLVFIVDYITEMLKEFR